MPKKRSLIPYLLLIAGIVGLLLIAIAALDVAYPRQPATYASSTPSQRATATPSTPSRSVSEVIPSPGTTLTSAPTTAPTVTPAPTATPTETPTPTPLPIAISPPFVSSTGALAYVEDGVLSVVKPNAFDVTTLADGVIHGARAAVWSPDGRWLLYASQPSGSSTSSTGERQDIRIWDGELDETLHLARDIPDFPLTASGIQDATWSPEGTRILFPCIPDASSCQAWVLDVTTTNAWRLPGPSIKTATWIDEGTILRRSNIESSPQLMSVGPPAQALTKTVALSGTYAFSPDRDHVAAFKEQSGQGQRLHVMPLLGLESLSLSQQPTITLSGHAPLWSPDGRWVAYGAEAMISHGENGPYTVLADTRGIRETQSFYGLLPVAWSPDSRLLATFGCSDTTCALSLVDAATGQATNLVSATHARLWDLTWSPRGVYLIYSLSSPGVDREGLMLWNRGTGEQRRLIQTDEMRPLTDLLWSADGCILYAAQREQRGESDLMVSAIWAVGPTWEDSWRIAPGFSGNPAALIEALKQRDRGQGTRLCPGPLLDGRRLVAYYGTPLGPGLGILGRHSMTETMRLLQEQAQVYRDLDPAADTIPVFHMVTTIADDFAGPDGDYNHRVPAETIRRWIDGMEVDGGWSILDVQPGLAEPINELDVIEPFLLQPNVHLAVDPEFIVAANQVPGEDLGQITGAQINQIQARMDLMARAIGHRKMLVIHQFDDRMIEHKGMILDYPLVDLVWDADGFGGPGAKIGDYNQYKREVGFEHGGIKIFYRYDEPLLTPQEVLSLDPPPRLVIYQ